VAELTTAALPGVLGIAGVLLGLCADRLLRHRGRVICKMGPLDGRTERQGEPGEEDRVRGVINAAMLKDREDGRRVDPNMTLELAIARLTK
jgi:hypothetical protein